VDAVIDRRLNVNEYCSVDSSFCNICNSGTKWVSELIESYAVRRKEQGSTMGEHIPLEYRRAFSMGRTVGEKLIVRYQLFSKMLKAHLLWQRLQIS